MWDKKIDKVLKNLSEKKKLLIVIYGPTASGKTKLAIEIAKYLDTEIISADSRQLYKEIPIATAQPSDSELDEAKHHLIGNISIVEEYDAYKFEIDALNILGSIFQKHQTAILCGGTGMYIDAVCQGIDLMPNVPEKIREKLNKRLSEEGINTLLRELEILDPEYFEEVDKKNPRRILRGLEIFYATGEKFSSFRKNQKKERDFEIIKIGTTIEKDTLHKNIDQRVENMIQEGLFDEIELLLQYKNYPAMNTIGAKEIIDFFDGNATMMEAIEKIKIHTKQYAKRQITWFKKYNLD